MPWNETEPMNEKIKFISACLDKKEESFQALCNHFQISCKTGYKYLNRYHEEGINFYRALYKQTYQTEKQNKGSRLFGK